MKKIAFLLFFLTAISIHAQTNLPIGTIRKPIITDASGNVISTNLIFSNQFIVVPVPTISNQVARLMDLTNNTTIVYTNNAVILSALTNVVNTGSGTGLVQQVSGRIASIASLLPGSGISISSSGGTNITITSNLSNSYTNGVSAVPFLSITNGPANIFNVITNAATVPIANGGNGTNTTMLIGSWTNTVNWRVNGTNDANAYKIQGTLGFTGVITNLGPATTTNITSYLLGIVTNNVRTP